MSPTAEQIAGWWRTLREHHDHGRCEKWVEAFTELVAFDVFHLGPPVEL